MQYRKILTKNDYQFVDPETESYQGKVSDMFINKALFYQQKYGLKVSPGTRGYNDETDAFRHTFMNAMLTISYGEALTKTICSRHESNNHKSPNMSQEDWEKEKNMDLWNNAIGREIGKEVLKETEGKKYSKEQMEALVVEKIIKKLKAGELITDIHDTRSYKDQSFKKKNDQSSNRNYLPQISHNKTTIDPSVYENLSYNDRVYYQGDEPTAIWDKDDEDVTKQDELEFKAFNRQVMNDNWKLPTKEELDERVARGELIWGDGYTKQDRTVVKGYFRHYPETA